MFSLTVSTLLWADLSNPYVWTVLLVTGGFGMIGFADDYLKLTKRNTKGLSGKLKLAAQLVISGSAAAVIMTTADPALATGVSVPFFKDLLIDLGILFIPFAMVVMTGSSNAVNLTDADQNGHPDYVDTVADVFDDVWQEEVTGLGYRAPPPDADGVYDIYIRDLSSTGQFGVTLRLGRRL